MTALRAIWIVTGSCGQYEDRDVWFVRAFTTNVAAQEFAAKLRTDHLRANALWNRRLEKVRYQDDAPLPSAPKLKYDPHMDVTDAAGSYAVGSLTLEGN